MVPITSSLPSSLWEVCKACHCEFNLLQLRVQLWSWCTPSSALTPSRAQPCLTAAIFLPNLAVYKTWAMDPGCEPWAPRWVGAFCTRPPAFPLGRAVLQLEMRLKGQELRPPQPSFCSSVQWAQQLPMPKLWVAPCGVGRSGRWVRPGTQRAAVLRSRSLCQCAGERCPGPGASRPTPSWGEPLTGCPTRHWSKQPEDGPWVARLVARYYSPAPGADVPSFPQRHQGASQSSPSRLLFL